MDVLYYDEETRKRYRGVLKKRDPYIFGDPRKKVTRGTKIKEKFPKVFKSPIFGNLIEAKAIEMQIFVNGAKTDIYDVSPSITIGDLKELIEFRSGVACDNQVLTFAGRPLQDEQTLSEGELQESSTIYLGERLLGGKVHGSLARAGKVKGQTPKVDAQEKKKPKTGRAKRRQQYNSRFVNVVVIPGRRRGPNSNAQ